MTKKWTLLHSSGPDGVRWFKAEGLDVSLAVSRLDMKEEQVLELPFVADRSGSNPERTDDGPNIFDPRRECRIFVAEWGSVCVSIPIVSLRDNSPGNFGTFGTLEDLNWLVSSGHAKKVTMTEELLALAKFMPASVRNDV